MKNVSKFLKFGVLRRPFMPIKGWYFRLAPWMITCREFDQFTYDYVDAGLSGHDLAVFNRHKRACPICRNFLNTYIATHKAVEKITPHSELIIHDEVPQNLVEAILDVKRQQGE